MFLFDYFKAQNENNNEEVVKTYSSKIICKSVLGITNSSYLGKLKNLYQQVQKLNGDVSFFILKEATLDIDGTRVVSFVLSKSGKYITTYYKDELTNDQLKNYRLSNSMSDASSSYPVILSDRNCIIQALNNDNCYSKTLSELSSQMIEVASAIMTMQSIVKVEVKSNKIIVNRKTEEERIKEYDKEIESLDGKIKSDTLSRLKEEYEKVKKEVEERPLAIEGFCKGNCFWNLYVATDNSAKLIDFSEVCEGNYIHDISTIIASSFSAKTTIQNLFSQIDEELENSSITLKILFGKDKKLIKRLTYLNIKSYVKLNAFYLLAKYINTCGITDKSKKDKNLVDIEKIGTIDDFKMIIKTIFMSDYHPEHLCKIKVMSLDQYARFVIKYTQLL